MSSEIQTIKTFKDLYNFLQTLNDISIFPFLQENWSGKEKQESLFRLFSLLRLFPEFKNYYLCEGNFNNKTISGVKNISLYLDSILKDSGDSSDATFLSNDNKELVATTSKNLNLYNITNLSISEINDNFKQYKDLSLRYCIVIPHKDDLLKKANNSRESSNFISKIILNKNTILIDHNDIDKAYRNFKLIFSKISINKLNKVLLNKNKSYLIPRLHQEYTIKKTLDFIENDEKVILWGHLPRSGKSYMMAILIHSYSIGRTDYNCLIITSVPNETIEQYIDIFNEHIEFERFNIIRLDDVNKMDFNKKINIIIASKQFLQGKGAGKKKGKIICKLQKLDIYLRFVDETHYGGTSEISHNIYELYGKDAPTIYMTATYFKPVSLFSIPKKSQIIWDLEDIKLCKEINIKENQETLIKKHGKFFEDLIIRYGIEHIKEEYKKFPDLQILNLNLNCDKKEEYIKVMNEHNVGFSFNALFMLTTIKEDKKDVAIEQFENEPEMMKLCNKLFYKNNDIHFDFSFEVKDNLLERIEKFCIQNNSRIFSIEKPLSILIFLPHGNYKFPIEQVSNTFKTFLIKNKFMEDYEIIILSHNFKQLINDANIKAINNKKKGVIILSGRKCSMGVTIPTCDIVMLMNDIHSADLVYQMMTRCLSEDIGKRFSFVVDLNLQRQISVIMEYALKCKETLPPKETLKYLLINRIINLRNDIFEFNDNEMDNFVNKLYSIWSNEPKNTIKTLQKTIYIKTTDIFSNIEQNELNKIFFFGSGKKTKTKVHESKDIDVHTGQERENNSEHTNSSKKEEQFEEKVNFIQDIIEYIVPFICIITVRNKVYTFKDMYNVIKEDKVLLYITKSQFITWWPTNLPDNILDIIMNYYDKVNETYDYDSITKRIKQIFLECKDDRTKFAETVIEYFKPTSREKKTNAEIPTPRELKLEMISKVPLPFWTSKQKVLEPSVGKGGFCLEVIECFMIGLKELYPDENERYKIIVEECLYFADINPVNIHITKLILDPNNEYMLNYYEGDFLKFELKYFGLEGFDLVIGNPPYQSSCGNKGIGNTLWDKFVKISLDILLKNGYIVFIHPQGWRQLDNKIGKIMLSKQILYLNMNDVNKGLEIFGCSTTFDYYLLQNTDITKKTIINDYKNNEYLYNLSNVRFIPNHSIEHVNKYIDYNNENGLVYTRSSYGADKSWILKEKTDKYKYPCVYTINKNNELSLLYSNTNTKGHFGVIKFIISNGCGFFKDITGKYGCTQWSYYIKCNIEDMDNIEKCLKTLDFLNIIDAVKLTSNKYNYVILKYLKKDFWKEFVDEDSDSSSDESDSSSDESDSSSDESNNDLSN